MPHFRADVSSKPTSGAPKGTTAVCRLVARWSIDVGLGTGDVGRGSAELRSCCVIHPGKAIAKLVTVERGVACESVYEIKLIPVQNLRKEGVVITSSGVPSYAARRTS